MYFLEHPFCFSSKDAVKPGMPSERVTFSFDSAGWLYVYQLLACISLRFARHRGTRCLLLRFGVAAFLQAPGCKDGDSRLFCADAPHMGLSFGRSRNT